MGGAAQEIEQEQGGQVKAIVISIGVWAWAAPPKISHKRQMKNYRCRSLGLGGTAQDFEQKRVKGQKQML